jgi:hypothetical protein
MWTFLRQQQQRGAQVHARDAGKGQQAGEAPAEAVAGREVQDHDYADLQVSGSDQPRQGDYPATNPPERDNDITPTAPEAHVEWDEVVQPEQADQRPRRRPDDEDGQPLPDGK